jgi:hypothetical protein
MKLVRGLVGAAAIAMATAALTPQLVEASPASLASCGFSGNGTDEMCGAAFTYGGGTVTVTADVVSTQNATAHWHVSNSDTYVVECAGSFDTAAPARTWTCSLPAGRFYFVVSAAGVLDGPGSGSIG